jgi:hypothetical protein
MMIRIDATAYSNLFTLLLRLLDGEKLVSGFDSGALLLLLDLDLVVVLPCLIWLSCLLAAFLLLFGSPAPPSLLACS